MSSNTITDILNIALFIVFLLIALRSFYLYFRIRSARLFILGLSMGVIALTALADSLPDYITVVQLNTDWFLFLGQTVSFMFILFSLVMNAEGRLRRLVSYHVISSLLLLLLLGLAPFLPDFPNGLVKMALSGSRGIVCLIIFFFYASSFMNKETRFSFLMGAAFLLLSLGYLIILPKYVLPHQELLDYAGDIIRVSGVVTMLGGFIAG
ncbi:MAG TPA: hypothetical protein VFB60_10690 [Ktedonobacteraceae bacterium]|nr:hypothetical protein [Ktedonobacteraceae bacterium]